MKTSYEDPEDEPREDDCENEVVSESVGFMIGSDSFESCLTVRSEVRMSSDCVLAPGDDAVSREDVFVSWDNAVSGDSTVCEDVAVFHEAESLFSEEPSAFTEVFARCKPQSRLNMREDVVSLRDELHQERTQEASFYELVSPEVTFRTIEVINRGQNWSDSLVSLPVESCEPVSEMYYTASSEVSLLSDTEVPMCAEKTGEGSLDSKESSDDRKDCVIAGHVAAMRERFESMTRTNTPCPDMMRSTSPSLDVFRNITPSPDRLG